MFEWHRKPWINSEKIHEEAVAEVEDRVDYIFDDFLPNSIQEILDTY